MTKTSPDLAQNFLHAPLLSWYDKHRRKLPWREEVSPYRTWVSEIMLQQTQVATVVPYFDRFLKRFPDIGSLAAAKQEEVLKHWAGLGYYSRARNLHGAAREVVAEYGGRLPETAEGLMNLSGIGRYTAGAIASIAFGKPNPLVDGNVVRVFSRLFAIRGDTKSITKQKRIWKLAESNLCRQRPGDWNQALMELGARICLPLPEGPRCGECPLSSRCAGYRKGIQRQLPETSQQAEPVRLTWSVLRIENAGKLLLWRRAKEERFLRGHWGLPEPRHLKSAKPGRILRVVRHSITHHRITLTVREGSLNKTSLPREARWVPLSVLRNHLVSSLWTKALEG